MKTTFILGCLLAAVNSRGHRVKTFLDDMKDKVHDSKGKVHDIYDEMKDKYDDYKKKQEEANDDWAALNIDVDGNTEQVYLATPFWFTGTGGDKIEIPFGGRLYLSNSYSLDPEKYFKPNFLGATVEYDVDLSQLECNCVAAFYLVSMPGHKTDGSDDPSDDKMYYCDANQVGGVYCPEFDIMEANTYSYRSTPHPCDAPDSNGYYNNCDRGGTGAIDVQDQFMAKYGPGDQYEIDTKKPFTVKIDWENDSQGKATGYTTQLTQNGLSISMHNNQGVTDMTDDLKNGMAFALSSWGADSIDWLEHGRCQGKCSEETTLTFTNLKITTAASKAESARAAFLQ